MAGKGELNTILDGYHTNLSQYVARYPAARLLRATGSGSTWSAAEGAGALFFRD